jgi:hypothetical protein
MQPSRANRPVVAGHVEQPLPAAVAGAVGTHELMLGDLGWVFPAQAREALEVIIDERRRIGLERYGQPLQSGNGRSDLRDALEEAVDLAAYLFNADRAGVGGPVPLDQMYRMAIRMAAWLALAVSDAEEIAEEQEVSDG